MSLSWWDIPGPGRFVRRIENDLRDRVNVVAALPAGTGKDWFDFFRRHWADSQERMDVLNVDGDPRPPLDILGEAFTTNPAGTTTLGALVSESAFRGLTIGILLDNPDSVPAWTDFLVAYERECRLMDPLDRAVLLVATEGAGLQILPPPETHLRVHVYDGYARPHDCFMYAWVLLGTAEKQAWRTELKMALCAQLAQWDPRLCEELSDRDIGSILRRATCIGALPAIREAHSSDDADEGWARGILQRYDGETVFHSGWIARNIESRDFERRVWAAQVQVLFPLIEQLRRQAIDRYGSQFQMPVQVADNEFVSDPYELEIAMVRRVVYRLSGVPRRVLRRLDQAYEFRNALAHLEPLTAQQLQAFEPTLDG
jgi:hypothetical protein